MNRRSAMKNATADEPRRGTVNDRSTAESFLAWLSMPELGTPVHGPVLAENAAEGSGMTVVPVRNGRPGSRRPQNSTRSLARR